MYPLNCHAPYTVCNTVQFDIIVTLALVYVAAAYKHADGKKIDGRRIVVDVERGRTVKTWKPRRLGEFTMM